MKYGLVILNNTVTSNHIHLLIHDEKGRDLIPQSIKLVAGRTGQDKLRKDRKGLSRKTAIMQPQWNLNNIYSGVLNVLA